MFTGLGSRSKSRALMHRVYIYNVMERGLDLNANVVQS